MVSLKQLHENLILEEIQSNFFLQALNEEINDKAVGRVAGAIDKLDNVVQTLNLGTLDNAMVLAQADADKIYGLDDEEAEKIISKITTFYSKMTYLLTKAIPNLAKVNLKKFFDGDAYDGQTLNDFDGQVAGILKKALTSNTGLFKRAMASIFGDSEWTSGMPYLNIDAFVNEFMDLTKEELKGVIDSLNTKVAAIPPTQSVMAAAGTAVGTNAPAGGAAPAGAGGGAGASAATNMIKALDDVIGYFKGRISNVPDTVWADSKTKEFFVDSILIKNKSFNDVEQLANAYLTGAAAPTAPATAAPVAPAATAPAATAPAATAPAATAPAAAGTGTSKP